MRRTCSEREVDRSSAGFTLIEVMVVVIVLGILAATVVPQFMSVPRDAKVGTARADIAKLEGALERFFLHMDRYPSTQEGLKVLVEPPADAAKRWRGPYLKELRPDPWGNDYQYRSPGLHGSETYDLWSTGAGGQEGGEGYEADITNWTVKE